MKKTYADPASEQPLGTKKPVYKCNEDAYCEGLDACFDEVRVRISNIISLTTGKTTALLPTIHAGAHKKKGILMNFCPFCGYSFAKEIAKVYKKVKKK